MATAKPSKKGLEEHYGVRYRRMKNGGKGPAYGKFTTTVCWTCHTRLVTPIRPGGVIELEKRRRFWAAHERCR